MPRPAVAFGCPSLPALVLGCMLAVAPPSAAQEFRPLPAGAPPQEFHSLDRLTMAKAQIALAQRHEVGDGVPLDLDQAALLYREAALQGSTEAAFNLAALIASTRNDADGLRDAAGWYRHAAERGDPDSQMALARHYRDGLGLTQDWSRAYLWYDLAAGHYSRAQDRRRAEAQRDELRSRMTRAEISRADRLARTWEPVR